MDALRPALLVQTARDSLNHLCSFLPWIDIRAIRCAHRRLRAHVDGRRFDFRQFVRQRVARLLQDPDEFLDQLHAYGNQLTGSFVLQCIYGETWRGFDVDVLVYSRTPFPHGQGVTEAHTLIEWAPPAQRWNVNRKMAHADEEAWTRSSCVEQATLPPADRELRWPLWSFTQVGCETGYDLGGVYTDYGDTFHPYPDARQPQVYGSLEDFVREECDFAFCRVLFDGRRLTVCDWAAVESRTASVFVRTYRRLPYYRMGDGDSVLPRMRRRIEKYRRRGFTIHTDLDTTAAGYAEALLGERQRLHARGLQVFAAIQHETWAAELSVVMEETTGIASTREQRADYLARQTRKHATRCGRERLRQTSATSGPPERRRSNKVRSHGSLVL